MPEIPYVPVAGLRVPATLVPRIIAAFRGIYPTVTDGLDDEAAVRAVLLHWVSTTLTTYESREVSKPVQAAADDLVAEAEMKGRKARDAAALAASMIVSAPTEPADSDLAIADFTGVGGKVKLI